MKCDRASTDSLADTVAVDLPAAERVGRIAIIRSRLVVFNRSRGRHTRHSANRPSWSRRRNSRTRWRSPSASTPIAIA